ncbi:MAG: SMC-Scp complex subunit ScpB [Chlamydiales bacterium]|nr:SMC-Scp complex subunit ScpB [Chlamydiales bacterium]
METEDDIQLLQENVEEAQEEKTPSSPYTHQAPVPSQEAQQAIKKLMKEEEQLDLKQKLKSCIEALLFSSDTPLRFNRIREILESIEPIKPRFLQQLLAEIQYDYHSQRRGFVLEEIAEGYIIRTSSDFSAQLALLHSSKRIEKLSHASTEALAIVAYKQPITRAGIDAIRGVDSSGALHNLLERDLVEPVGKQSSPGRPTLYGTTPYFLQYFGLRDLSELKTIHQLEAIEIHEQEEQKQQEESEKEASAPTTESSITEEREAQLPSSSESKENFEISTEEEIEEEEGLSLSIDLAPSE